VKKIFIIIFVIIFSTTVYADEQEDLFENFTKWLAKNEFTQYYKVGFAEPTGICKDLEKFSHLWYYNKCDEQKKITANYKVDTYNGRSEIPEHGVKPSYETLLYYYWNYTNGNWFNKEKYSVIKASESPYQFQFDLREDKNVKKQMQKTALLSYILFEEGKIVVDELSPKDKFGKVFTNETRYHSQSVGKSIASYILGHAICKGHIESIDAKLNDWPLIKNSLYHNQKIIDLINMNAGDEKYFSPKDTSNKFANSNSKYSVTNRTIKSVMESELKNSKKSKNKWAYNNLLPHLIMNYIIFKAGDDGFLKLLEDVFTNKAKIEYYTFFAEPQTSTSEDKAITSTLLVTRYDYLRIAKAMLDDWQNDTCEGKYLKSLYERKIKKNYDYGSTAEAFTNAKSYGGFFHLEPSGMKKRHIFIMDGYGGQTFTIDFDKGRIVATLAIHRDFNWKKIAHSVIKKGK
jgi:hypothetical protein